MTQNSPEHSEPQASVPQQDPPAPALDEGAWAAPDPWPTQGPWQPPQSAQAPSPQHTFSPSGGVSPVPVPPQGALAYGPPPGWGGAGAQRPLPGHGQWGPKPVAYPAPVRFEQVPGEGFGLAILPAPRSLSGVGVGSLVAGIGSILVSGAVWCFGLAGASGGWGGLVGGAFFVLSALLGLAAVVLGVLSLRQVRRASSQGVTGRGYAISGVVCGGFGLLSAAVGLGLAIVLSSRQ